MKKLKIKLIAGFVSFLLVISSVLMVNAETVYVFEGYSYTLVAADTVSLKGWNKEYGDLLVPDQINGRRLVSIANYAFYDNHDLSSIDLSQAGNLTAIGLSAFNGCSDLSGKIVLNPPLTSLGALAFQDCPFITDLEINADIAVIPAQCFNRCYSLSNVSIPDSVTAIQKFAFANCTSLESITLSKNVTSIDATAFYGDSNLTIKCYKDSYAQEFAESNHIQYELLDPDPVYELGDVNLDGIVNIADATEIQRHVAKIITFDDLQSSLADVNHDGAINVADATQIQRYVAGLIDSMEKSS